MPTIRSAVICSLFLCFLVAAGCTSSIEGDITINGAPLPGVTVSISGLAEKTVITDDNGHYLLETQLIGPEYTITPSLDGHLFAPEQRTGSLAAEGLSNQDFVAALDGAVNGHAWTPADPVALIVTTGELAPAFEKLAILHTTTGIHTEVVTVEDICGGACNDADPLNDTAKAIKDYLTAQPSLKYVVLGGDMEEVPSRQVMDSFYLMKR